MQIQPFIAGMPSASLTDLAEMRLEVLSFFILAWLICGWILKKLWNSLARDFSWMPSIGFRRALALLGVTGLFLYVILTMISGARELMTPGAWKKSGATYELNEADQSVADRSRKIALQTFWIHLASYAKEHGGKFPPKRFDPAIPRAAWVSGDAAGLPFEYIGNAGGASPVWIVAYEPTTDRDWRWVLFSDGTIDRMADPDILKRVDSDSGNER